jgi:hypothetical protein
MNTQPPSPPQEILSDLFGSYKAEWLRERIFELFAEPTYFPELQTARPCVLVGGRGTGKTTALRCLAYDGRLALGPGTPEDIRGWKYYGFYYRVNTNRVTAFSGSDLPEREWARLFAHYMNLELCELVVRFLLWYTMHCGEAELRSEDFRDIAAALNLPPCKSTRDISDSLTNSRITFEAYINNITDADRPKLSMQGAPVDLLLTRMQSLPQFHGRLFFFLIDEYENFIDYQQQVINTLIKHGSGSYAFKVGVRELGWRQRNTLNENEFLVSPADYVRIDIADKLAERFPEFAAQVCNERLRRIPETDPLDVRTLLESLTEDEEAVRLGVVVEVAKIRSTLDGATEAELKFFDSMPPLQAYFVNFWAAGHFSSSLAALQSRIASPKDWTTRYDNYKFASLFTIRRKKRGVRKFYAGWSVLTQLAGCNIRYLLELLEQSLLRHVADGRRLGDIVSAEAQTRAAQRVGKVNLSDLEGVSVQGAKLTKLLLGLGRVFQVMAAEPEGHAPEMTQFHLSDGPGDAHFSEVEGLIKAAVMHMALTRFAGSKLQDDADTREYDYAIHPIYSALFEFSYRKKRKFSLSGTDLLALLSNPKPTIEKILQEQGREKVTEPLPEQLELFAGFYAGNR